MKSTPADYLSKSNIDYSEGENGWSLAAAGRRLTLPKDLSFLSFQDGDLSWKMSCRNGAMLLKNGDGKAVEANFSDCCDMESKWYEYGALGGYFFTFKGFAKDGVSFDITVRLYVALNWQTGDIQLKVLADEPGSDRLAEFRWPGGFEADCTDNTVMPYMQGMLLPKNWEREINGYWWHQEWVSKAFFCYSQVLYMPWWGVEFNGGAAEIICETAADFGCVFHHPAGGPTLLETRLFPSLGKFRYERKYIIKTARKGNYVTLAKLFRQYTIERGRFVSLVEKIARSPKVGRLLGSAILHQLLMLKWRPGTRGYNAENQAENLILTPASEVVWGLQKLYDNGLKEAYLHLDGWDYDGYDALEPDSIPIGPMAGGEEGVRAINKQCHDTGYLFALHEQFRDNYLNCAGYDPSKKFVRIDGSFHEECTWPGGTCTLLCPEFSPEYVRRNNRYFESIGLKLDGAYLDVFSVCPLDECTHPEHPVTRRECLDLRVECFNFIRSQYGIISSEEASDWTTPYIDLVHHAPWGLEGDPSEGHATLGYPIPLFNLVYHDSLITPWSSKYTGKGSYSIPPERVPFLCCLLNAGMPYMSIPTRENDNSVQDIKALRPLQDLHKQCGTAEMLSHRFISEDFLEEETTFSDGTVVTANHRDTTWKVEKDGMLIASSDNWL